MCGEVKRVIMGLDRMKKTPCGFCFVEYPKMMNDDQLTLNEEKEDRGIGNVIGLAFGNIPCHGLISRMFFV